MVKTQDISFPPSKPPRVSHCNRETTPKSTWYLSPLISILSSHTLPLLALLLSHGPLYLSPKTPSTFLPQDLCSGCSLWLAPSPYADIWSNIISSQRPTLTTYSKLHPSSSLSLILPFLKKACTILILYLCIICLLSRMQIGKLQPESQITLAACFVNKVLLIHIVLGCFHTTTVRLSSCNRGCMVNKAKNIYYLSLYRKSLLTPAPECKPYEDRYFVLFAQFCISSTQNIAWHLVGKYLLNDCIHGWMNMQMYLENVLLSNNWAPTWARHWICAGDTIMMRDQ